MLDLSDVPTEELVPFLDADATPRLRDAVRAEVGLRAATAAANALVAVRARDAGLR